MESDRVSSGLRAVQPYPECIHPATWTRPRQGSVRHAVGSANAPMPLGDPRREPAPAELAVSVATGSLSTGESTRRSQRCASRHHRRVPSAALILQHSAQHRPPPESHPRPNQSFERRKGFGRASGPVLAGPLSPDREHRLTADLRCDQCQSRCDRCGSRSHRCRTRCG